MKKSLDFKYEISHFFKKGYYFDKILDLYSLLSIISASLVFSLLFILIDKFNILSKLYSSFGVIIIIITILFFIIKCSELKLNELIKFKTINYFDVIIFESFISLFIYFVYLHFSLGLIYDLKMHFVGAIIIISIIILIFRKSYIEYYFEINKKNSKQSNVYDLIDLYNDKIKLKNNELIYIGEKAVDYDLLNRDRIIRDLYDVLTQCKTDSKFVISLNGKWGSGKTTIINNVKKEIAKEKEISDKVLIVDDFDPWIYETQESLFRGLFDNIIKKLDMNFSITDLNKILNSYSKMLFAKSKINFDFSDCNSSRKSIIRLRKMINSFLEINDKQLIIIIDNIERANKENIFFLFKVISTILDFNKTIYLLSFDNEQMEKIFDNFDVDYKYLEKIIQKEMNVPIIDKNNIDTISLTCFNNLLKLYGVDSADINSYSEVLTMISGDIKDIREIKRSINSLFNINRFSNNYLNKSDALLLEVVAIKNPNLYESIYKNSKFYISEDYILFDMDYFMRNKEFNEEAYEYFEDLFSKSQNNQYIKLLCLLFPYVKKYNDYKNDKLNITYSKKFELRSERNDHVFDKDKEFYIKSIKDKKAFNGRFFELYFTYSKNEFIEIDNKVREFVSEINNNKKYDYLKIKYIELLRLYDGFASKYTLETLEYYIEDIDRDNYFMLLKIVYSCLNITNDESSFMNGLNAKNRASYIISEIINRLNKSEQEKFINIFKGDYSMIREISNIVYWLKPEKQYKRNLSDDIYIEFNEVYKKTLEEIKSKKINLYNSKYYSKYNIFCFWNDDEMLSIIGNKINTTNVFLFLEDIVSESSGTNGYGYTLNEKAFEKILSYDKIKYILDSIKRKDYTEKEKFLISLFEKAKETNERDRYIYLEKSFIL